MRLVYLIGGPGVGKTTAMNGALDLLRFRRIPVVGRVPHEVLMSGPRIAGAHLGVAREGFGGTDTLSMSIAPHALSWLSASPYPLIVGEGDRLTSGKWLGEATTYADVVLVHLDCGDDLAERRREFRAFTLGARQQSPQWIRGRYTKVANIAAHWPGELHSINTARPASDVALAVARIIDECPHQSSTCECVPGSATTS